MAAPHASGVAALLVEQVGKRNPGLVRNRLAQSADDLGEEGRDPIYGRGRINAAKALGL
jgi:subtilisin family serine protease